MVVGVGWVVSWSREGCHGEGAGRESGARPLSDMGPCTRRLNII